MNEFGTFLRELRGNRSLREMQKMTGLSHTYLSSLEKGVDPRSGKERKPTPDILRKLSETLEVEYTTLMEKAGYSKKKDELEELIDSYLSTTNRIKEVSDLLKELTKQRKKLDSGQNKNRDDINQLLYELTTKGISNDIVLYREGLKDDIKFMQTLEREILESIQKRSNEINSTIKDLDF
ncbi:helix-turn-helix transcriptional regulator [Lysinibacillus irui]|uniref:Helix-turn-helix transcriptional regulator n=1 Tax=Lysinibacillus irui TaxID=2998077 RepID=A0ABU5NFT5_9BACI|nr:helix-turn-helix transcriptional regulator [Lysinibacillus irui]MEA0554168.1 helix-turn-helix transcriptional regulator [Lysinibacillus irui]MEA0974890.1 helix-turn-helix transcriptional regulator [Lysinibacillus irui]MEA1041044.1 helix-turn-helix transcriptional regulator [Lysinibacillus irui]